MYLISSVQLCVTNGCFFILCGAKAVYIRPMTTEEKPPVPPAQQFAEGLLFHLRYTSETLQNNMTDITHEESVWYPECGCNCINWLLGHIVFYRARALKMCGGEHALPPEYKALYAYGSKPVAAADAQPLSDLLQHYHTLTEKLEARIKESELPPLNADQTGLLAELLGGHEMYHQGQISIVRRLLGKGSGVKV